MIIFQTDYGQIKKEMDSISFFTKMESVYKEKLGRRPGSSEMMSWVKSIPQLIKALENSKNKFPDDMGVLLEYSVPHTRSRIDVIFTGFDNQGKKNAVIVELKQWTKVTASDIKYMVNTWVGDSGLHKHPSYQAKQYKKDLIDIANSQFNNEEGGINLSSCAFLHNHEKKAEKDIYDVTYEYLLSETPSFSSNDTEELSNFIYKNICKSGSREILEAFENVKYSPSKRLIEQANKKLEEIMEEFKLYGEQNEAFEIIRDNIQENIDQVKTNIFIISGSAGTGKTIVALKLYLYFKFLAKIPRTTALMFPGADFRGTMMKQFNLTKAESKRVAGDIIASPTKKTSIPKNFYDIMIIDEAHKLKTTASMGNARQYEEVVKKSKNVILLTDRDQVVDSRSQEGYEGLWKLNRNKYKLIELNLSSQFRMLGGKEFTMWLDMWLKQKDNGQEFFVNTPEFQINVLDDINDIWKTHNNAIKQNIDSRILATSTSFDWTKKIQRKKPFKDVVLGSKKFAWYPSSNVLTTKNMKGLGDLNRNERSELRFDYNLDSKGSEYVGYFNTVQGSEFNHVSIYVGPEFCMDDKGELDINEELMVNKNSTFQSTNVKSKAEAIKRHKNNLEIFKNQLKVLLTRAISRVDIYFADGKTREYVKSIIK